MKTVILSTLLIAGVAFAGPAEREAKAKYTEEITKASKDFQLACGCALKMNVNWDSYKKADDMRGVHFLAENFSEDAKGYCKDAETKKAMCALKTVDVTFGKDASLKYASGKASITTTADSYIPFNQVAAEVDK